MYSWDRDGAEARDVRFVRVSVSDRTPLRDATRAAPLRATPQRRRCHSCWEVFCCSVVLSSRKAIEGKVDCGFVPCEEDTKMFLRQVAPESSSARRLSRQSVVDLGVALVSVPLLVVFGLLLETNMRGDWTESAETRWHVLGLGLALLFVSILVCGYVTHRLGICIWAAQQPSAQQAQHSQRSNGSRSTTGSQLHLVVSGELPPSYESVVSFDAPPPYCSVLVFDEKAKPTTTG